VGSKRNVIDLYKFVCRNYEKGDDIYGLDSAAAFRSEFSLSSRARGPSHVPIGGKLARMLRPPIEAFDIKRFPRTAHRLAFPLFARRTVCRNLIRGTRLRQNCRATKAAQRDEIPIRFLDFGTRGSIGMPIESSNAESTGFCGHAFWRFETRLLRQASRPRAILDDERTTFHRCYGMKWEASWRRGSAIAGRITQVWFAGVHSNVGVDIQKTTVLDSLEWIMGKPKQWTSLQTNQVSEVATAKSPTRDSTTRD